jgi:O-antigen biosynthesis protein
VEREGIVCIGGFNHPANVDAMMYSVAEILPLVHAQLGSVPAYIVASQAPAEVLALEDVDRGVCATEFVPDVTPFFVRARLSIAPLRNGAGVEGEVTMSTAYEFLVLASPCAAERMFLESGENILIGENAPVFADHAVHLYRDRELWEALSAEGRVNVRSHLSRGGARAAIEALLADLVK